MRTPTTPKNLGNYVIIFNIQGEILAILVNQNNLLTNNLKHIIFVITQNFPIHVEIITEKKMFLSNQFCIKMLTSIKKSHPKRIQSPKKKSNNTHSSSGCNAEFKLSKFSVPKFHSECTKVFNAMLA